MNNDFTSQISAFKAADAEIVTGNMIPPDFATFWSQAAQQGFKPKIVTIGKALLFPSVIDSLGARGNGLTIRNLVDAEPSVQVRPHRPEREGTHRRLCRRHQAAVDAADRLPACAVRGGDRRAQARQERCEPKAILDAIVATNYKSIVGPVKWTGQPVKNVTKTPLVAGQWQRKGDKFDLVITDQQDRAGDPGRRQAAGAVVRWRPVVAMFAEMSSAKRGSMLPERLVETGSPPARG